MITRPKRRTRAGLAFVWTVLGMTAILTFAAFGIDVALWYVKKAAVQTGADAAALAGAYDLGKNGIGDRTNADLLAAQVAVDNGVTLDTSAAKIASDTGPGGTGTDFPADSTHSNWYRVHVTSTQTPVFAGIAGIGTLTIRASATAQFTGVIDAPIPSNIAGVAPGKTCNGAVVAYNYSSFGPKAQHTYGDNYSPEYMQNLDPNGLHPSTWNGFDFDFNVPSNYSSLARTTQLQVELWDPDSYNQGNQTDASATAVDEIRSSQSGMPGGETNKADTTLYTLVYTPFDTSVAETTIASASYSGASGMAIYDGYEPAGSLSKLNGVSPQGIGWVTPSGFTIDTSRYDPSKGRIHLREQTTDGSSENGFTLRAGPPHTTNSQGISMEDDCTWNTANGSLVQVAAHGIIPMNFNVNGTATITLGTVPAAAAGGQFTVTRFDTDVGVKSIVYSNSLGETFTATMGALSVSDNTAEDVIKLPKTYQAATWYVAYTAGGQDTSTWKLSYSGGGRISLVGEPGTLD